MQEVEENTPKYLWWEKTVEYTYLANLFIETGFAISPLAGKLETNIGDAIVNSSYHFGIIEFKKKYEDINSESRKYNNGFENYGDNLMLIMDTESRLYIHKGEEPHSIVYGELEENTEYKTTFLKAVVARYWFPKSTLSQPCVLDSARFLLYLEKLAAHRKTKEVNSSSGGSIFGFDNSGTPMVHIDLSHALKVYDPKYVRDIGPDGAGKDRDNNTGMKF